MNKSLSQQVFFTVLFFTLFSGGTSLWLTNKGNLSPEQHRIFELSAMTWQMGTVSIFGLLGAKAKELSQKEDDR